MNDLKDMSEEELYKFAVDMRSDKRELEGKVRKLDGDVATARAREHELETESRQLEGEVARTRVDNQSLRERLISRSLNLGVAWGFTMCLLLLAILWVVSR